MSKFTKAIRDDRFDWSFWAIMILLASAVGVLIYWAMVLTEQEANTESDYERFHRVCAEQGGFVADTPDPDWLTERIDCIKDNNVLYLPGFA